MVIIIIFRQILYAPQYTLPAPPYFLKMTKLSLWKLLESPWAIWNRNWTFEQCHNNAHTVWNWSAIVHRGSCFWRFI